MKEEIIPLVQRALRGDETAYQELMEKYYQMIYRLIYQIIKNREETEDLVQDSFMKAFRALPEFDPQYAFSTWLYKIAYNTCIDTIRKRKLKIVSLDHPLRESENQSPLSSEMKNEQLSPEETLLFSEKQKHLQKAIEKLPEIYRQVIILRHQEELSYEQISEMLALPVGTIKARIFRAREMLKKALKELE